MSGLDDGNSFSQCIRRKKEQIIDSFSIFFPKELIWIIFHYTLDNSIELSIELGPDIYEDENYFEIDVTARLGDRRGRQIVAHIAKDELADRLINSLIYGEFFEVSFRQLEKILQYMTQLGNSLSIGDCEWTHDKDGFFLFRGLRFCPIWKEHFRHWMQGITCDGRILSMFLLASFWVLGRSPILTTLFEFWKNTGGREKKSEVLFRLLVLSQPAYLIDQRGMLFDEDFHHLQQKERFLALSQNQLNGDVWLYLFHYPTIFSIVESK